MEVEVHSSDRIDGPLPTAKVEFDNSAGEPVLWLRRSTGHRSSTRFPQDEETMVIANSVFEAISENITHSPDQLEVFGDWVLARYHQTRSPWSLELVAKIRTLVMETTPQGHPSQVCRSIEVAKLLAHRSENLCDINSAIHILDGIVRTGSPDCTHDSHDHASLLTYLGNLLGRRFSLTRSIEDLNRAIEIFYTTIESTPEDHPERRSRLNNIGGWLAERGRLKHSVDDLNRSIEFTEAAVSYVRSEHPKAPIWLMNLAQRLGARFEETDSMDDLQDAVKTARGAVNVTSHRHPMRVNLLNTLGGFLQVQFDRRGCLDDLDEAVKVYGTAIAATPPGHPAMRSVIGGLGSSLSRRFQLTGSIDDLNQAIEFMSRSVDHLDESHDRDVLNFNELGRALTKRYVRTGSEADLERAIKILQKALELMPRQHRHRLMILSNLSAAMAMRPSAVVSEIINVVDVLDGAFQSTIPEHPDYLKIMGILGAWLGVRSRHTQSIDDLERAIKLMDTAVDMTPLEDPERVGRLNNLGKWLCMRFVRTKSEDDIGRAIKVITEAEELLPPDHHDLPGLLTNLLECYATRSEHSQSPDDVENQIACCIRGWNCRDGRPSTRIFLARYAGVLLSLRNRQTEAIEMLEGAVRLLPSVSPRSIKTTEKQRLLEEFSGLASLATAVALDAGKAPEHALSLLELGRGVIAGLLLETRSEITELKQSHPKLASEFEALRDDLDLPSEQLPTAAPDEGILSWEEKLKKRRETEKQFRQVIEKIRLEDGFNHFLLPPKTLDLMAASSSGPVVVVNTVAWRHDAFLIDHRGIRALRLMVWSNEYTVGDVQTSPDLLEELLWNGIARPVLDELGFSETPQSTRLNDWPRIWWIMTGALSRLPIHASGRHYEGSSETVLGRVVSSYSTSVKALLQARQHSNQNMPQRSSRRACLVSMRTTPPSADLTPGELEFAEEEIQTLKSLLSPSVSTTLLTQPQKRDILEHVQTCNAFHFAGHGVSDPNDPSKSCLLLEDWVKNPLTVDDLTALKLFGKAPWLAYLSACSTGENRAEKLQDESIHLVSACQLAGFPHVIGSLWRIDDECSAEAAAEVYRTIQEHGWTDDRGAYVVRAVAGLLHYIRALTSADASDSSFEADYNAALETYRAMQRQSKLGDGQIHHLLSTATRDAPIIKIVGAFDTVKAVNDNKLFNISLNGSIQNFRHALALNETREAMVPEYDFPKFATDRNLVKQPFVQAWFIGAHIDMGGSSSRDGLSLYPLQWMLTESKKLGLKLEFSGSIGGRAKMLDPLRVVGLDTDAKPWTCTTENGIVFEMRDMRRIHEHRGYSVHLNRANGAFWKRKNRAPFDQAGKLEGFCPWAPQGTTIHPSVYLLLDWQLNLGLDMKVFPFDTHLHLWRYKTLGEQGGIPTQGFWNDDQSQELDELGAIRILVCGNSGVGKSSLINRVFGVEKTKSSERTRGKHNVKEEITWPGRPDLIIHDSEGFEAAGTNEFEAIEDFLKSKSNDEFDVDKRLHAIWFCLEVNDPRPIQQSTEKLFLIIDKYAKDVPVVVIATKKDEFEAVKEHELRTKYKKQGKRATEEQMEYHAADQLDIRLQKLEEEISGLDGGRFDICVAVSKDDEASIKYLTKRTSECFSHDRVRLLYIRAQVARLDLKAELALGECMRVYRKVLWSSTALAGVPGGNTTNRVSSAINLCQTIVTCFGVSQVNSKTVLEIYKANIVDEVGNCVATAVAEATAATYVALTVAFGGMPLFLVPMVSNIPLVVPTTARLLLMLSCDLILIFTRAFKEASAQCRTQPDIVSIQKAATAYRSHSKDVHAKVKQLIPKLAKGALKCFKTSEVEVGVKGILNEFMFLTEKGISTLSLSFAVRTKSSRLSLSSTVCSLDDSLAEEKAIIEETCQGLENQLNSDSQGSSPEVIEATRMMKDMGLTT
ncbi:hypothetical protein CcaCcLH18_05651 [Colletotrichum camelliae]|nr:hypothetical protein CcaCcLH18_05651 [Colletotrichum camelliae]